VRVDAATDGLTPPDPMTTDEKVETERANMVSWRFTQLVHAGCDDYHAQIIAGRFDIPLHDAIDLLNNECSPTLMVAILL
jgi:hypothetical protein